MDIHLSKERDGVRLSARLIPSGKDWCVVVAGGDRPHIGSVAVGIPRSSLSHPEKTSATVSTINLAGHKDDVVANRFSAALAAVSGSVVTVACGIHIDRITPAQLRLVQELAEDLLEDCIRELKGTFY